MNDGSVDSHQNYCEKFSFNFPLLSDKGQKVAAQYGAKGLGYVKRTVVIVDKEGFVRYYKAGMPSDEDLVNCIKGFSSGK